MAMQIRIGQRREFQSRELWAMHRLRTRMFRDRMGWDVPVMSGMEIDGFDALDPYYLIIGDGNEGVSGCWRLLPTVGPNMLKDTFSQLLHGQSAPESEVVWELSRFAIEADGPQGFSVSELTANAMREMVVFADRMGITHYVTVTTTAIERLMRRTGIAIDRFGPPLRIGVENAIALDIDLGEKTHDALFGKLKHAA